MPYLRDWWQTIVIKNVIFVLPLPEYVWFGEAKLILNSTITLVESAE